MEPEKTGWANLSLAQKVRLVGELVINAPYIVGKVMWDDFDHNNSKEVPVPKISFGYDVVGNIETGNLSLYWLLDMQNAYERRLFGIKREEFCTGDYGKGNFIKIISPHYLEQEVLEENIPQIARVTYEAMPRSDDGSPIKYTLLEGLTPDGKVIGLKPFPKPVLSAIKKSLDDIMLL